jgi:hypothetical protein
MMIKMQGISPGIQLIVTGLQGLTAINALAATGNFLNTYSYTFQDAPGW